MTAKKVAIVIANYNCIDILRSTLESISRLSYTNYKVVIVDDCSANSPDQVLTEFPEVVLLKNKKNMGFASTNNRGIRYALRRGADYIMLLNNDTEVTPHLLNELLNHANKKTITVPKILYFKNKNRIWYAGGIMDWEHGAVKHIGMGRNDNLDEMKEIREVEFACGCCMLIHKDIINEVGYLPEEYYLYHEDVDYSVRVRDKGIRILYVPTAVLAHRIGYSSGGTSVPYKKYYFYRNRMYFIKKYSNRCDSKIAIENTINDAKRDFINGNFETRYYIIRAFMDFLFGKMYRMSFSIWRIK